MNDESFSSPVEAIEEWSRTQFESAKRQIKSSRRIGLPYGTLSRCCGDVKVTAPAFVYVRYAAEQNIPCGTISTYTSGSPETGL